MARSEHGVSDLSRNRLAAWLAVVALAVQSLIPLIVAAELGAAPLAERLAQRNHEAGAHAAGDHRPDHRPSEDRPQGGHHHLDCPICSSLSVAKTFAPPSGAAFVRPALVFVEAPTLASDEGPCRTCSSAPYSPRAPPSTG